MAKNYNADSIKILEGLEAVRKRPGMYIGSTDKRGLHHLAWEIIDNCIDEIINGYGDKIKIRLNEDGSITIADNGRGVPIGKHASGKSTPEVVYTVLHAGGKFEEGNYKVSGGLHGVGASVVNALSTWMDVTIYTDGLISNIRFKNGGEVDSPLKTIGESKKTGTCVTFMPNYEIFKGCNFSFSTISERMRESAFLIPTLTVELENGIDKRKEVYHYDNGISSFVEFLNEGKSTLNNIVDIHGTKNRIGVDIALQYTNEYSESIISFVNNVKTVDGGSHEVGFKSGLTKVFNEYAKNNGLLKGKDTFDGGDLREGLTAVINLKIPEDLLQFEGQTKGKLGTPEARTVVDNIVYEYLKFYLEENRKDALSILEKASKSKLAREAARKARDEARLGKNKKESQRSLSDKLTPPQGKNAKINELFIVEGNSAGGTAKKSRDRKFQGVLPLRGKILNTEKASLADAFKNEEINTMIHCIGAGVGQEFDINDINYDKVIIMTDADDDGAHIQCLLLTFFYRFMRPLIEYGHLYIAMPPLFKVDEGKDKINYFYTNEDFKEYTRNLKDGSYRVQRYKGLGEMNPEPLRVTTMSPETRNLIKVNITDAALAEKRVSVLMGDAVDPRKDWINENVDFSLEDDFKL